MNAANALRVLAKTVWRNLLKEAAKAILIWRNSNAQFAMKSISCNPKIGSCMKYSKIWDFSALDLAKRFTHTRSWKLTSREAFAILDIEDLNLQRMLLQEHQVVALQCRAYLIAPLKIKWSRANKLSSRTNAHLWAESISYKKIPRRSSKSNSRISFLRSLELTKHNNFPITFSV